MFKVVNGMRTIEFGQPGNSRFQLVNFVVNGNKRATAGLLSDYQAEGEPIEHVGERLAVLNNDDSVAAIVEVTEIDVLPFLEVPDRFALAEAEGDLNAEDFRNSHREYWQRTVEGFTEDELVVTMYFDVVEIVSQPN
jgi:uncharacterized protein YhfF